MTTNRFEQFNQCVLADQALQVVLAQSTTRESFLQTAEAFGKELGLNLTAGDFENEIIRQESHKRGDSWIGDELLESVAGFQMEDSKTGTCTCQGCSTFATLGCHTGSGCDCAF